MTWANYSIRQASLRREESARLSLIGQEGRHGRRGISRKRSRVLGARRRHSPREVHSADGPDPARRAGAALRLSGVHRVRTAAALGADADLGRDVATWRAAPLVRPAEDRDLLGGAASADADSLTARLLERDAANRRLGLLLDGRLPVAVARPPRPTEEPGLDRLLELVVGPRLGGVGAHERLGALVHRLLDRLEGRGDRAGQPFLGRERLAGLAGGIAPGEHHRALLDVPRADLEPQRDTAP